MEKLMEEDKGKFAIEQAFRGTPDATDLVSVRRQFAEEIGWTRLLKNQRVLEAFANVPRENFLPKGPWLVYNPSVGYIETPSDDPRHVYHNTRIALDPERILNNGEPGLTASVMDYAEPKEGEKVVHIGCGAGYFTAVWAQIIGEKGQVTAIEIDEELAERAKQNLKELPNVNVISGNGAFEKFEGADIIVMSAGTNRLQRNWVESLNDGGRLLVPFTLSDRWGQLLRVTRDGDRFTSEFMKGEGVTYYELQGARDDYLEKQIKVSLEKYGWDFKGRIYLTSEPKADSVWLNIPSEELSICVE